jgi:hypothetical protein
LRTARTTLEGHTLASHHAAAHAPTAERTLGPAYAPARNLIEELDMAIAIRERNLIEELDMAIAIRELHKPPLKVELDE